MYSKIRICREPHLGTLNLGIFMPKEKKFQNKSAQFWGKHIHHYANTAKMLLFFQLHIKYIVKAGSICYICTVSNICISYTQHYKP